MKRNLDSKGYAVSPFFIVVLILLGAVMAAHFTSIDNSKSKRIAEEGELNKVILDIEEPKATLQSLALFSAYQAAYEAGKKGISDEGELREFLNTEITEDLNSYESGTVDLSGDFRVEVDDSDKNKGFLVHTTKGGTKKEVKVVGDVTASSKVGVDKFVGARIFLLRDLAEDDVKGKFSGYLAEIMKKKLEKKLDASCEIRYGGYDIDLYCERNGAPPSNPSVNDGDYVTKLFEESVVDLQAGVMDSKYFPEITDTSSTIEFAGEEVDINIKKTYGESVFETTLLGVYSDTLGEVGTGNTVSIAVRAMDAEGMRVSQYGDPEYLRFVSHSHGTVPSDDAEISTTYKCIKPGKNILLKLVIFRDWPPDYEIIKKVTCK